VILYSSVSVYYSSEQTRYAEIQVNGKKSIFFSTQF